jgi:predicted nuclease of restriction endonuclease-like (RecB) superfamily
MAKRPVVKTTVAKPAVPARKLRGKDAALYQRIHALVTDARQTLARGFDLVQVHTCFEVGRHIVLHEQQGLVRAGYGQVVLESLAQQLTAEFGRGFSRTNIAYMRSFYAAYQDRAPIVQTLSGQLAKADSVRRHTLASKIVQTASGQSSRPFSKRAFTLSWSHYIFLLGIKNADERSFYEIESAKQGWNLRELKRQFDTSLYERLALSRDKAGVRRLAREGQVVTNPADMFKDPVVLEFLGLDVQTQYAESDLEEAIINQVGSFLLELGKGFLFEARQKRFSFDGSDFYVDLVFYNRLLRCYVLVDLKIGSLAHQDLGQMQMYVNYFDRHIRQPDENPTVGIILCKKRSKAMVEITLAEGSNIHAREYSLYLPSKEQLQHKLTQWLA